MNARRVLAAIFILVALGLLINQWRLQRAVTELKSANGSKTELDAAVQRLDAAAEKVRQAEARYDEVRAQLEIAAQRLSNANTQIAAFQKQLRPAESGPRARLGFRSSPDTLTFTAPVLSPNTPKRSWGPEQAVGEPDTFQAGDISTAWASREPDGGDEWLKLDYENSVDISEVRVRETHNPGAISKVTAFLNNGTEVTLWEGVEPKAAPPVEMSFQVPDSVNAKSVKVYLDTKRVPGWNEIDAVQMIGRDGSQQWAKGATASSTYAEPRVVNRERELDRF